MNTIPQSPATPERHQLWTELINAPGGGERRAFARYCSGMVSLVNRGIITRQEAVFFIAEPYGISRFDDSDQMEEVMQRALQLEDPAMMTNAGWEQLCHLVAELNER